MPLSAPSDVTQLLRQWSEGDQEALNRLVPLVYGELRRLAHQRLRRESGEREQPERRVMTSFAVTAIGKVESPLTQPESAPRQPDKGAPAAWLVFEPEVLEGLQKHPTGR